MSKRRDWWWTCVDCSMQRRCTDKDGNEARALKRAERMHRQFAHCRTSEGCIRMDEIKIKAKPKKSVRQLVLEHLDEHLLSSNVHIAQTINRPAAQVSSVTNRLWKAGVLVRLHYWGYDTHHYALRANRHVARLMVKMFELEQKLGQTN